MVGKSSDIEEGTDMNEVEEQFENIELSQDSTETLPMENMLGQLKKNLLPDFFLVYTHCSFQMGLWVKRMQTLGNCSVN